MKLLKAKLLIFCDVECFSKKGFTIVKWSSLQKSGGDGTLVEHSTHQRKGKGTSLATTAGTGREKNDKTWAEFSTLAVDVHVYAIKFHSFQKTQTKQILGYLPLAFVLPGSIHLIQFFR
jgi:hypothetical protein